MKNFKQFAILIFLLTFTFSCKTIKVQPPPKLTYDKPIRTAEISTVKLTASVSQSDMVNILRDNIKNPVVDGSPLKVISSIKAIETITDRELIKEVIKPYTPGHWIDVQKKTYKTVQKAYSCIKKPWKWSTCFKDVLEEVWVATKVWIEPELEVFKWTTKEIIKTFDKVYKTEVTIHYPTDLVDVGIKFTGNQFEIKTEFLTKLKFDYEQAVIPLGPTLHLNNILEAPVSSFVNVKGNLNIISPGKIEINIDENSTNFHFGSFSPDFPLIEGNNLDRLLLPVIANVLKPLTEKMAKEAINKALIKAIENNTDKLNFRYQIDKFTASVGQPKAISENLWLNVNPSKVLSGQVQGFNNRVFYTVGLEFKPQIDYSPSFPSNLPNQIPFIVQPVINDESYIDLQFAVKLKYISQLLNENLNDYINKTKTLRNTFRVSNVELFKTNEEKLAVKLTIQRKRLFGYWTFFSNAYLTTKLNYDSLTGLFSLEDILFTLETKSKLITSILSPLVDDKVIKFLKENSTYSIHDKMRIANSAIKDTTIILDYGTLTLKFSPIEISKPYITVQQLEVNAKFKGKIAFNFIPPDQQPMYSKEFSTNHLGLKTNNSSNKIEFERANNSIIKERSESSNQFTYDNRIYFSERSSESDSLSVFSKYIYNIKIGDIIFLERDGKIIRHVVKFEDLPKSDEILISRVPGKIERLRPDEDAYQNSRSVYNINYKVAIDTIKIHNAINYIDKDVVIDGVLKCIEFRKAASGETIKYLHIDVCKNDEVGVLIYLGSVSDNIPDQAYVGKKIFVHSHILFEGGKPTLKIKKNGNIKIHD